MPAMLDPKVDLVFKRIFGAEENQSILISLLNAVLGWSGDQQITAVKILNPYLEQENINDSLGILDIKAQLGSGELVDVEMQIGNHANMEKRSTFYTCRIFGDQKIRGGRYQDLKRAIAINILDFVRIKASPSYHTRFRLLETEEKIELTDAIEIHFIELPKLQEELADYSDPLDRWAMFLKGSDNMELLERLSAEDPAIAKARQELERMGSDPRAREIFELRLKAIMDRNSDLYEAEMKGEQKGRLKGRLEGQLEGKLEGRLEGRLEGKLEGKLEGRLEVARKMLKKGMPIDEVADLTALTPEQIQKSLDN